MSNSNEPIIEVHGAWKRYGLPPFFPWNKLPQDDSAYALRDISFSVPRGGSLAILGRNGAGKSTLLKMLAGVTPPDRGTITVRGSIFPMIELTAGINMELSGRENTKILGTIMGKMGGELHNITPKVLEFSELGDWFDRPVWQYSSGMLARLAFSIAINVNADILIVDEVLGVGDIQFQKKCQLKVQEMLGRGSTLVFVSHSPYQVERLCDSALYLEAGNQKRLGPSSEVVKEYLRDTVLPSESLSNSAIQNPDLRAGTGDIRVLSMSLTDESGNLLTSVTTNESFVLCIRYRAKEHATNVSFRVDVCDAQNTVIGILGVDITKHKFSVTPGEGELRCRIPSFPLYGSFSLSIVIKSTYLIDSAQNFYYFFAEPTDEIRIKSGGKGMTLIDCDWEWLQD